MSGRRLAAALGAGLVLLGLAAATALYWASRSEAVLRWGVGQFAGRLPCKLAVEGLRGSVTAPVRIGRIVCENADLRFEASQVELDWSPWRLRQQRLDISRLKARNIALTILRSRGRGLPESIALPIAVNVDVLEIGSATLVSAGRTLTLRDIAASYRGDTQAHRLTIASLASDWGTLAGEAQLGARAPLPLSATLRIASEYVQAWPVQATLQLSGTASELNAKVEGRAGAAAIAADLVLAPLAEEPLRAFTVRSDALDLAVFDPRLPHTALMLEIEGAGRGRAAVAGRLRAVNSDPGTLDRGRLPLRQLDAAFSAGVQALQLREAVLDLGAGGGAEGGADIEPGRMALQLQVRALDLRALRSDLRSTKLAGRLDVESQPDRQRIAADLREKDLQVEARAEVMQGRVRVEHLLARSGGAQLAATGELDLAGDRAWSARGRLRGFDPARFGDFPAARINGTVNASGILRPQWRADLQYALSSSRFRGQLLDGSGKLTLSATRVSDADAQLSLAGNRIRVRGGFGQAGDSLSFDLDAPKLAALGAAVTNGDAGARTIEGRVRAKAIEGRIRARGTVAGTRARPALDLEAEAGALRYDGIGVGSLSLRARLEQADDPKLEVQLRAERAGRGDLLLDDIAVDASGTLGAHVVSVKVDSKPSRISARLDGGWHGAERGWAGMLARLEGEGDYAFRLNQPAPLELARGRAMLGATSVRFEQTLIALTETRYGNGDLVAAGSVTGVRAARVLALTGSPAGVQTTLVMGGRWSIRVGKTVDGLIELARESGDVTIVTEEALALGLREARIALRAEAGRLHGQFSLAGTGLSAQGEARSVLERRGAAWGLSGAAPLQVEAGAKLQSVRAFAALASRALNVDGSLDLALRGSGTIAKPKLQGSISGDRILVENVERGVFLRDGALRAKFGDDVITVDQFTIKGGAGSFAAKGTLASKAGAPRIELDWTAQKLAVVQHPDLRLTVSGAGKLGVDDARISLAGELNADQGRVELRSNTAPALGADVVVAGRESRVPIARRALNSELDLMLDLGPDFLVSGRGVDLRLAGRVRLVSTPGSELQARGDINVARGTYVAYGQKLVIDKGVLRFAGPVDNPGLELRAMRRNQEVAAGVEVTGTARNPLVRLISEPEVPDPEKLSWLVLGRRVESGTQGDAQALQASAVAMAAGLGTMPLQQQLARAVGLDEISYTPGTGSSEGGVVAVGKRISDKVYVSHHHSVSTATNTLRVSYQLSRYWSLRTESGTTDAVDVFFTFPFD